MDPVDVQILRKLTWNPNDPHDQERGILGPWDIARELQIHGTTVKRRLEDLESSGILQGMHMWPELSHYGIRNTLYAFHFSSTKDKDRMVAAMEADEAMSDVYGFVGKEAWVGINAAANEDPGSIAQELAKRFHAIGYDPLEDRSWGHEPATELELRIVDAFRADAFRTLSEVADEVGVTPLTVRKRLDSLREKRAFILYPFLYPARMQGMVPFMLTARSNGSKATMEFLRSFPDAIWRCLVDSPNPYVLLATPTTADMAEWIRIAESIPGIREVRTLMLERSRPCQPHEERNHVSGIVESPDLLAA